jgi:hypothetical protein
MSWIKCGVTEACELRSAAGHDPREPTSRGKIPRLGNTVYWEEWGRVRRVTTPEGVTHFKWQEDE